MSRTTRVMNCGPQAVFDVLSDGWSYATWVVGAARIRAVDEGFPAPGTRVHHSVGLWPALIDDSTHVERFDPPHLLQLRVRAWPAGEGQVTIACEPQGERTLVTMLEEATSGPATLIPSVVEGVLLRVRNTEALRRLAFLAEGRGPGTPGAHRG